MPADQYLASLSCRDELNDSSLSVTADPYVEALLAQRYAKRTIGLYLHALAHFGHWMKTEEWCVKSIDAVLTECFVREHLPGCTCSVAQLNWRAASDIQVRHMQSLRSDWSKPPRS